MTTKRVSFSSKIGLVLTTAGAAIGLGNIWRFPYTMGEYGGAAFFIVYLICIVLIGLPLMLAEVVIGRRSKTNAVNAFQHFAPGTPWYLLGFLGITAETLLMGFYVVISGWTLYYLLQSLLGHIHTQSPEEYITFYQQFIANPYLSLACTLVTLGVAFLILVRGVNKGIERVSCTLMPVLFVLLIATAVRSCLLPAAKEGLLYMFQPDFSKLTMEAILSAIGQALFSLCLGQGCIITYASYYKDDVNLVSISVQVAFFDTLVALTAGIAIFPTVFSFGLQPQEGPGLVFETLPNIFGQLEFPILWSSLFYLILYIAALTSFISMAEVTLAYLSERLHLKRWTGTCMLFLVVLLLAIPCTLSFGCWKEYTLCGKNAFDWLDYVVDSILIPLGGMLTSWFAGWYLTRYMMEDELSNHGTLRVHFVPLLRFLLRYIIPIGILSVGIISALEL